MLKLFGWIAAAIVGLFVLLLLIGPSKDAVSDECRQTVSIAAVNVDAWMYIHVKCSEQEQQALLREFKSRGISTEQIDRSRAQFNK